MGKTTTVAVTGNIARLTTDKTRSYCWPDSVDRTVCLYTRAPSLHCHCRITYCFSPDPDKKPKWNNLTPLLFPFSQLIKHKQKGKHVMDNRKDSLFINCVLLPEKNHNWVFLVWTPLEQHRFVDFLEGPTLKWGPRLKEHPTNSFFKKEEE